MGEVHCKMAMYGFPLIPVDLILSVENGSHVHVCKYVDKKGSTAMHFAKRLAGVAQR